MVGFDPKSNVEVSIAKAKDTQQRRKWEQGFAGALSGIVTRAVVQPLDVVKIRFQLQLEPIQLNYTNSKYGGIRQAFQKVINEEGIFALWKGHVPAQYLSITYGITQFVTFEFLTLQAWNRLSKDVTNEWRPILHFFCGGIAGSLATFVCQPFDVIRTRFVSQGEPKVYGSVISAARTMLRLEGPFALYRGLTPTLLQIMPYSGIQFSVYTSLVNLKLFSANSKLSVGWLESLLFGGIAGIVAKITVYPLDLIKKRLQVQGFENERKKFGKIGVYRGLSDCFIKVIRSEGIRGLYKGLAPSTLKASLACGFSFCIYEQVDNMNETVMVPSRLMDISYDVEVPDSNNDYYAFYSMLNAMKNELLWGGGRSEDGEEASDRKGLQQPREKGGPSSGLLQRRLSTVSSLSLSDSEADTESLSESDSGRDMEFVDQTTARVARNFRHHLVGLYNTLNQLTDSALVLTGRYQQEIDVNSSS